MKQCVAKWERGRLCWMQGSLLFWGCPLGGFSGGDRVLRSCLGFFSFSLALFLAVSSLTGRPRLRRVCRRVEQRQAYARLLWAGSASGGSSGEGFRGRGCWGWRCSSSVFGKGGVQRLGGGFGAGKTRATMTVLGWLVGKRHRQGKGTIVF